MIDDPDMDALDTVGVGMMYVLIFLLWPLVLAGTLLIWLFHGIGSWVEGDTK